MSIINKKVILIGNVGVGKTSLVSRFVKNIFSEKYLSTIGVKVDKKSVIIDEDEMNLLIWDIAGEANFTNISKSYYLGAHGCIFVADATRINTFTDYHNQLLQFQEKFPKLKIVKVVNKIDLISEKDLAQLQNDTDFDHYASAKSGEFINEIFTDIAKKLMNE